MQSFGRRTILAAAACLCSPPAYTQDMMRHVDLSSPMFASAEMTRAEVEASLTAAHGRADFSGKSLNAWVAEQLQAAVASIKSKKVAKASEKGKGKSQRAEKHA